jgi:hypothetical protein
VDCLQSSLDDGENFWSCSCGDVDGSLCGEEDHYLRIELDEYGADEVQQQLHVHVGGEYCDVHFLQSV